MSGKRFQARAKTVQKLGRDGLMEKNMATGEEKSASQRTADISFGPDRMAEQVAGHRAAQRDGSSSAPPAKKRRKQPRPIQQTAEEAVYATPETGSTPEVPAPEAAPSMRMAADAPMLAPAVSSEGTPPPLPASRRRKRKNRKKSKQQQAAKHTPNAAGSPEVRSLRGAGDVPMQNRPPGKRPPRPVEGGGRLKFKATEDETAVTSSADDKARIKKRQARRFAPDAAQPAATDKQRPSRLIDDSGGRLRFEDATDDAPPDGEPSEDVPRAARKRQTPAHADVAAKSEDGQQAGPSATVDEDADARQRASTQSAPQAPELSAVPGDRTAYKKRQAAKFAAHSAVPAFSKHRRLQFEDTPPMADNATVPAPQDTAAPSSTKYDKAMRRVERAEQKVEQARDALPVKRRLSIQPEADGETGRVRRRLHFENETLPEYRSPSLPARAAGMAKTAAVMKLHGKIHESERDNVAVEATHKSELFAEQGVGRTLRWGKNRRRAKPYLALRQAEQRAAKENLNLAWQTALRDNPELRKKNALMKWIQKQKIKRKYAQAAHEAKQTAQHTRNVVNATGQIARAVQQYAAAHKSLLAVVALLAMVVVFFAAGMTSCTAMLSGFQSSYISASYMANEQDICNSDLYYTEMETDLQIDIDKTEENYPGYDEYRYNIGEISHNPYELMGYLSTMFNAFTFDQVQAEIARLFGEQYQLTREVIVETRYDSYGNPYDWYVLQTTLTVTPLSTVISEHLPPGEQTDRYNVYQQTLGNRQAYGNPFDFPWLGYVSSGYGWRVHPISGEKNLHRGVDIAVAQGTPIKTIHDGRVVSTGDAGDYGLCIVIEDEKGYQSRYAHCSSLSVTAGQEVKRGDVIGAVGNTGNSTGPHLHLEIMLDGEYLNPYYFVDTGEDGTSGIIPGEPGGPVIPDYPGEPVTDDTYAAMLNEAQKYLGYPYVWGGSSPSTSFDCSGFVSWVINHSGWDVGRLGAQGLYNICTPVSLENAQPGDLIFFWHTYDAPNPNGVTHVGIYVGNGQMIHCGDPISYANINSSYWQQHYYGMGRLP